MELEPSDCINYPIVSDLWGDMVAQSDVDMIPIYKEPESRESEMGRHGQIKNAYQDASKHYWKRNVTIVEKYKQN